MQDNDASHFNRKLGRALKEARQLRGMTQTQLGAAVGVSYQQIQKFENGASRISAERLDRFAHILKVPLSYFLNVKDEARSQWTFPADTLRIAASINALPNDTIRTEISRLVRSINWSWATRHGQ